jgi:hypothetical protein
MRTAKLFAVAAAVVSLASLPLVAQQVNTTANQSASGSVAGTHVNQSANAGAQTNVDNGHVDAQGTAAGSATAEGGRGSAYAGANSSTAAMAHMRPVTGELQSKLDSKTARVGQPVVLKTTEKTKTADGIVIPRGSRLIGHVTEVQAHARGHQQSSLGIAFDRAELKNGQSFAIHSVIESVGPSAAALEAASMENQDAFAGPAGGMAAGGAMSGGAGVGRVGGGVLGGGGGMVGGAASNVGRVGSGLSSTAGGAANAGGNALDATGNLAGNASGNLGRGLNGSAGAVGALGVHATTIPGVMLDSNAVAGASGMFTAAKQNIHFDGGTRMVLGVAAAR